jgi:hypothetical protein
MSLQALPPDPALPGLRIASDQEQMRDFFRRHLRPLPATDWEIESCRLSRVHYHRAQRCSLRYTLRLVDGRTRRERPQWVTGLMYAGDRAERIWRKLRAADRQPEVPDAFGTFEPLAFIPDLEMLAQVFPYDRHLPALSRLTIDPVRGLESVFLGQFGPGDWHIEDCGVKPVQYRIGRVAVLRYEVEARTASMTTSERKCFFAKVYRDAEQAERTHRVLETLSDRPAEGTGGLTVAKPVAYLRDLGVVVQEKVPGRSLQQILLQGADGSAVEQAARALAVFRRGRVDRLPRHGRDDEVTVLQRAGQVLGWACPHLRGQVEAVVSAVVARLDEVPLQPTHRELRTDHIFLDGDRVAVVDLDSCAASDPVLDPARILGDLAGLPLRLGTADDGRWDAAAQAFAEEYLRSAPEAWRARLLPHYAGALLKEAVDFFRHLEPRWPESVAVLIHEAEDSLSRRDW